MKAVGALRADIGDVKGPGGIPCGNPGGKGGGLDSLRPFGTPRRFPHLTLFASQISKRKKNEKRKKGLWKNKQKFKKRV